MLIFIEQTERTSVKHVVSKYHDCWIRLIQVESVDMVKLCAFVKTHSGNKQRR